MPFSTVPRAPGSRQPALRLDVAATSVYAVDAELAEVLSLELLLHDPEVRNDPQRLQPMLHDEFYEYGASGRTWTRASMCGRNSRDAASHHGDAHPGPSSRGRRRPHHVPK